MDHINTEEMINKFESQEGNFFEVSPFALLLIIISLLSFYFSFRVYKMMQQQTKLINETHANSLVQSPPPKGNDYEEPEGVVRLRRMSDSYDSKPKMSDTNQHIYRI